MRSSVTRTALLLAFAASSLGIHAEAAGPTSVGEAKRALESALQVLAKAVQRAEKDPPSPEDLKAAERAVGGLARVIDAGASHEAQDLEYAKAALQARKELRRSRELVAQRIANEELHEHRRRIDLTASEVQSALSAIRTGSPSVAQFERAQNATTLLGQVLAKSAPLEKRDSKFDAYLREVRGQHKQAEGEISKRRTQVQVAAQISALDGARKKLDGALVPLAGASITDAAFDAAERAAVELEKTLDAGRALEDRDKDYAKLASTHRSAAKQARKTIETKWGEAGLARLQAELEPPHRDLKAAARWLATKNPAADRIAEANTASIVVAKLLEKSAHLSARSPAVRAYLAEVKRTLLGVQVDLQRRRLEPARTAVNASMKKVNYGRPEEKDFLEAEHLVKQARDVLREGEVLEGEDRGYGAFAREVKKSLDEASARITARRREIEIAGQRAAIEKARADLARALIPIEGGNPDRSRFDEAGTAAIVLEKTLDAASGIEDRDFKKHVMEMRSVLVLSRRKIEERRLAVEVEAQQARVEGGRREIEQAMKQIFGRNVPEERLGAVEKAVAETRKTLDAGQALTGRDKRYAVYDREVRKRLEETLARLATRRDELAVQSQQERVTAGLKALERGLAAVDGLGPKGPAIKAAEDALNAARIDLEAGSELEKRLAAYRSWAAGGRKTIELSRLRLAKKKLELAIAEAKLDIEARLTALETATSLASQPAANAAALESAGKALRSAAEAIEQARSLEAQSVTHERFAEKARAALETQKSALALATSAQAFRVSIVRDLESGTAFAQDAAETKNPQLAKDAYAKAVEAFRNCQTRGESQLEAEPRLSSFTVLVEKSETKAKEVIAICKVRQEGAAEGLRKVSGIVALREGPIRAFEAATALLEKGASDKALAQFEECISSGKIVRYKNPELESEEIIVLGKKTTLVQLIEDCTAASKRLRAK